MRPVLSILLLLGVFCLAFTARVATQSAQLIGREVSMASRLAEGDEFLMPLTELLEHGRRLFTANWTIQEGGGRPFTGGTGAPLNDPTSPLIFPRNFNRVSAPDANSCAGCHNAPFGIPGGGGDVVTNVFVLGQRFDFATFDTLDALVLRGSVDESNRSATLQTVGNSRATLGMFGSGFIEMLARQVTADLQAIRDATPPGAANELHSKGISFGHIARHPDGTWDTSMVEGLPAPSLISLGPSDPPNLIVRPFHQSGTVVSLRQFTVNAFNHHHGIQPTERFGVGTDPDGDGFTDEMSQAEVTATTIFQAALPVPGRVIPNDPYVEAAVLQGEGLFTAIGCATCHIPSLPLDNQGWIFTEPNPFNPPGNRRPSDGPVLSVDLTDAALPAPRLRPVNGVVSVPAFTDFKLHDITTGPDDPNREPLDMNAPLGSPAFFAGNGRFLTRKLWGIANEPPFFHHGLFTTMREAVEAHHGDAQEAGDRYRALPPRGQDAIIEFLKTLQVLPPGTPSLVVDEEGQPKAWPPAS